MKKYFTITFLSIISIIISFTICEFLLRTFWNPLIFDNEEDLITNKPKNSTLDFPSHQFIINPDDEILYYRNPNYIGYNKYGIYNKKVDYHKPDDEYRILVLGDSVLEGSAKYKDGFPKVIERRLNKEIKGKRFNVLNSGVGGWNTYQEYLYLKRTGIRLRPDLIILAFVNNDLSYPKFFREYKDHFIITTAKQKKIPLIIDFGYYNKLVFKSYFLRLIFISIKKIFKNSHFDYYSPTDKNINGSLDKLILFLKKRNIPLVIIHFPYFKNLDDYSKNSFYSTHVFVKNKCKKYHIPYLDLLDSYRKSPKKNFYEENDLIFHSMPAHPNDLGNKIAGDAISDFLISNFFN